MTYKWLDIDLNPKVYDIISCQDIYHQIYYESEKFSGPSLYFHQRALSTPNSSWLQKIELIYAVLASWGMHRMGSKGSKMQAFGTFYESINSVKTQIEMLSQLSPQDLTSSYWVMLKGVFRAIRVMSTATILIGNSKVLAHLLPNIVAPIDREYTLNFLFEKNMFQNDIDWEWQIFRKIHDEFYYQVLYCKDFDHRAEYWMRNLDQFPWDTSKLKIIDNLVIGAKRETKRSSDIIES